VDLRAAWQVFMVGLDLRWSLHVLGRVRGGPAGDP
jgi:hypothetical protein